MKHVITDQRNCNSRVRSGSFLAILILLFIGTCPLFAGTPVQGSSSSANIALLSHETADPGELNLNPATDWTLIYSDSLINIYSTPITCESASSVRLKFENLTSSDLSISYKIWTTSTFVKTVALQASQTLEGICATAYSNLLVEAIPPGSSLTNINVQITYNQ